MQLEALFALGLGLTPPWKIVDVDFIEVEVHMKVDFEQGPRNYDLPVDDTLERKCRHLNLFEHLCRVHARVPRVWGPDRKASALQPPWAQPGSGFTMDFEALALELAYEMPVASSAPILTIVDTSGITTYTHDSNGNLTEIHPPTGNRTTMSYDKENRLIVHKAGAAVNTMTYDGDGLKRAEIAGSGRTTLVWDGTDYLQARTL